VRDIRQREKPEHQSKSELAEWERLFGERKKDGE